MAVASGRWLIVTLLQKGEVKNRIVVWDLDSDAEEPIGSWMMEHGDVYHTIVMEARTDGFQTLQVFRTFDQAVSDAYQLIRFDWPPGQLELLERNTRIRIWRVST